MTWTERIKLAWTTFKREALPLYGWTLILIGSIVVLVIAMVVLVLSQLPWASHQITGGAFSYGLSTASPAMPLFRHFAPNQGLFDQNSGLFSDPTAFLATVGSLLGMFSLFYIVIVLIGSLFCAGQFNLTAKAYREEVSFGDFRFSGFLRVLGFQLTFFLIYLILIVIGIIAAMVLNQSTIAMVAFFIIYGLFYIVIQIYTLPWLLTSMYYILAHREQGFFDALSGSWRFFQRHMGELWGYIGTVILIRIALYVLLKISVVLGVLASFAVYPFIMVLAIVWVLSLDDEDRKMAGTPQFNPIPYAAPYPEAQTTIVNPPPSDSSTIDTPAPQPEEPKISLQKEEPLPPLTEDKP